MVFNYNRFLKAFRLLKDVTNTKLPCRECFFFILVNGSYNMVHMRALCVTAAYRRQIALTGIVVTNNSNKFDFSFFIVSE